MSSQDVSDDEGEARSAIDILTSYIAEKLHLTSRSDADDDVDKITTVDQLVEYVKNEKPLKIITMVGAGISTAAGIPDFRSPGSGLYDNLQKYDLPYPEAIFVLDYFNINAKPFFALAKELYPGTFTPTKSHYFIKLLENKGLLLRHYTQNIDTLERVAGIDEDKLVEAHGSFHTGHCLGCNKSYTQEWMKEKIFEDEVPTCVSCPGVVKPDIVFFGENLPKRFFQCVKQDFNHCNLLIIMGSSLAVQPFATLINRVKKTCPRLLINREKAGDLDFQASTNKRNILMLGDCDEQVQILVDKLGWGDELKELQQAALEKVPDSSSSEEAASGSNIKKKL